MNLPARARIVEVGPRDGFQMEKSFIPTDLKIRVVNAVARAGVGKIEATSFVSPRAIPQLSDAAAVMAGIERLPGVKYTVLIPNLKGAERAAAARSDAMRMVVCASEAYNQKNVGMSVAESLAATEQVVAFAAPLDIPVEVAIGLSFGCPFEGEIPEDRVVGLARKLAALGVGQVSIADSVGLAHPVQVERLMARLRAELPDVELSLHIHNTRGLGLANVLAGLQQGIDTFDASIGGLGGCPVNPGATGNIPTEDLVNLCEEMGVATGIDLEAVLEAARMMQSFLGRALPSSVLFAGTKARLYRAIHH